VPTGECLNTGRTGRPLCLNRRRLDAVKPVAAQGGVPLGSVIQTSAPAIDFAAVGQQFFSAPSPLYAELGHQYRRGPHHADAWGANGVSLLPRSTTTASGSWVGAIRDVLEAYFGARRDPAGLCQQCAGWSTSIPCSAVPVGP
jgi:hypothetical protein